MKNVHFYSLGCARNLVDSEVMAGLLQKDGYTIDTDPRNAELIIVNTCGFIDSAKEESINTILEAAQFKNNGKCEKLVVAGCLSERYPGELKKNIPEIDLVTGTAAFSRIIDELKNSEGFSDSNTRLRDFELPRINSQSFYTAYLKLAEGCAKRCSFCIIPKLRGKLRSRSEESLVNEATALVAGGVRELNLIAQDLTDYGRDRDDGANLTSLLKKLAGIEELRWIRLFYAYPDQLGDDVIDLIRQEEKICSYLDMPLQHIDDSILRNMNRHTNAKQIRETLKKLREGNPEIVIRTSLMVGFPGETEEQFNKLLDFVGEGWIDQLGVFTYSHEEGTASYRFEDNISPESKSERQEKILAKQSSIQEEKLQAWKGRQIEVLVEGPHPDSNMLIKGRHYGQAPEIDNCTIINEGLAKAGDFVKVEITEIAGLDLVGRVH